MGEILLSNLRYKSFSDFTTDLVGPMAGFFLGWSYWFMWVVTAVADSLQSSATCVCGGPTCRHGYRTRRRHRTFC